MEALGKDGRYELRDPIGQGSRGTVHHATDARRRAPVVVKRLDPARAPPAALAKYSDSVAALRKSSVAGLVLPLEIAAQDPAPHLVYAPLEGESLESALRTGPLQWTRAVQIVASLATTLAAVAAATGQAHLALKPTNVWLAPDGAVLVLDHGVTALGPGAPLHRGNAWLEYRAPEQLDGAVGDARSDVFSLAVLLHELSTGVHPFSGATAFQAAQKLAQTPPDLAELTRGMSPAGVREATKLMNHALAAEPDERPADVAAFATLLAYVRPIVGVPNQARSARPEPAPEPQRPVDPSTLQSLPQLRQLLVQRSTEAAAIPVLATPVEPTPAAPPPTPPSSPVALEPLPAQDPPTPAPRSDVPHAPSRPHSAPIPSRKPLAPPDEPRASPRPIAPEPDEPPTLVGDFNKPEEPEPAPAPKPAPAPAAPAREEHTVVDRARAPEAPAPADRTVVDYAMPAATPRPKAAGRPEQTEILRRPDADDDDEEDRPTVALIRGSPGEATLMLPDLPQDDPATKPGKSRKPGKKKGPAPPSAKVQWTIVAVNVICVLLVLAALAYTFL